MHFGYACKRHAVRDGEKERPLSLLSVIKYERNIRRRRVNFNAFQLNMTVTRLHIHSVRYIEWQSSHLFSLVSFQFLSHHNKNADMKLEGMSHGYIHAQYC